MKFTVTIDDTIAAAILAHHGQADAPDPVEAMRGLVQFTLAAEAINAAKVAAMKEAESQIESTLDAALEGKFSVSADEGE